MRQERFDFDEEPPAPRRRRKPAPKPGRVKPRPPAPPEPVSLLEAPVVQRCGLCGHRQTLLGETALCDKCGGIIMRDDTADEA